MARINNPMDLTTYNKLVAMLDGNIEIPDDVKAQILLLTIDFYKRFPEVPLDNFIERLKDVKILGGSKYLYNKSIQYLPKDNEIVINKEILQKDETDVYHSMMKVLLSMITAKDNSYGFAVNENLEALNEGFCDMVARTVTGNEGISGFEQESEIVDFIGRRIGVGAFTDAFFTNNPNLLLKPMLDLCGEPKELNSFLNQINNGMYTKMNKVVDFIVLPIELEQKLYKMFGEAKLTAMKEPMAFHAK